MGICTLCNEKREKKNNKNVNFNLIPEEIGNYNKNENIYNNNDNKPLKEATRNRSPTSFIDTKASSVSSTSRMKLKPEIYSIEKFGVRVKTKQALNEPLKFIFHFNNFKCKMLAENRIYIMQIIFDGKEYPLSFGSGKNPSFIFDETIGKEIMFSKMSSSYMEIILYTHKNESKNVQVFKNMTKGEILAGTQLFSCLKIDLLTLVLAPEKHDLVLLDPKRTRVQLGRINYNISCKQIEDISIKVKSFRLSLNKLNYKEIALNLKYENTSFSLIKETEYSDNILGIPNAKENSTIYQYLPASDVLCSKKNSVININNKSNINNKDISLIEKIESNKKEYNSNDDDINDVFFDDMDEYDVNSSSEKLKLYGKMSLNDILNSEITLNIFSVRLKSRTELDKIKNNNVNLDFIPVTPKQKVSISIKAREIQDFGLIHKKLDLINKYTLIGVVSLNFYKILYDNENKIEREASQFFHSVTYQKYDELNKTISNSKINSVGIEENLENKTRKENKSKNVLKNILISPYENVIQHFVEDITNYDGETIGSIDMCIEITKLPLIKQTMFGVLTETGFEINSIFLYDNYNISNDLPEALLELVRLKEKFEHEISTNIQQFDFDKNLLNIMQGMKSTLGITIEDTLLYYGYSSEKDIFQAQEVIIDLGLILFELIDKLGLEHRKIGLEILILILKRAEIDLGTLSVGWFKTYKCSSYDINTKNNNYEFEFRDNILLERGIIEKFLKFHVEALNFSLDNIKKGKNIDYESRYFTNFYLSIAYCLNPLFREEFIKHIYSNINLKDTRYIKFLKNMKKNVIFFSEEDNYNKTQSNFIIWDDSFYKKLESSLNKFKINKNINLFNNINTNNNNDVPNKYIKNINAIKEQLSEIKYTITKDNNNNNDDCSPLYSDHNWCNKIKIRSFIFYDYILELLNHILKILNKIDENNINTKWTKIPGIDKIIEVINYDIIVKDAKCYPKQMYEILPIFYSEISIINQFIATMIVNTNLYDTQSIFAVLNILDHLFNKEYNLNNFNKTTFIDKIDYKIIQYSFSTIINTENSLGIAKYIWFYYKNISILSKKHTNKILKYIIMQNFFIFFFHWSFQIREIFYYFLIYIINHKIKNLIKTSKEKKEIKKSRNIFDFFLNYNSREEKDDKMEDSESVIRSKETKKYYYFGDLLNEKMVIIEEIQKIIKTEKYDMSLNGLFNEKKYGKFIEQIPLEYHPNIIVGINHFNEVYKGFVEWDNDNKEKKIDQKNIVYPKKDIMIIKDDTIQYNN